MKPYKIPVAVSSMTFSMKYKSTSVTHLKDDPTHNLIPNESTVASPESHATSQRPSFSYSQFIYSFNFRSAFLDHASYPCVPNNGVWGSGGIYPAILNTLRRGDADLRF